MPLLLPLTNHYRRQMQTRARSESLLARQPTLTPTCVRPARSHVEDADDGCWRIRVNFQAPRSGMPSLHCVRRARSETAHHYNSVGFKPSSGGGRSATGRSWFDRRPRLRTQPSAWTNLGPQSWFWAGVPGQMDRAYHLPTGTLGLERGIICFCNAIYLQPACLEPSATPRKSDA